MVYDWRAELERVTAERNHLIQQMQSMFQVVDSDGCNCGTCQEIRRQLQCREPNDTVLALLPTEPA